MHSVIYGNFQFKYKMFWRFSLYDIYYHKRKRNRKFKNIPWISLFFRAFFCNENCFISIIYWFPCVLQLFISFLFLCMKRILISHELYDYEIKSIHHSSTTTTKSFIYFFSFFVRREKQKYFIINLWTHLIGVVYIFLANCII